jgi:hypothetical protein
VKNPLIPLKAWAGRTFRVLKAFEEAIEYRFEDYAEERIDGLERRVALLEDGRPGTQTAPAAKH